MVKTIMEEKAMLNQLRLEQFDRLSPDEKGQLVAKLRDKFKFSYRELEKLTGIPHSTLLDWVTGRQKNVPGSLHISIDRLIEHFKVYKPTIEEKLKIDKLIEVLDKLRRG